MNTDDDRGRGTKTGTRPYRKKKRARQEEQTRRRITEAVVELHRTVGPAKTTVTEVAERAGVSRMTVYNHFPTEADLIEACSTHWAARNPFPDPEAWTDIADPEERLTEGLGELFAWYRGTEDMMGNVLRDVDLVDPLGEIMVERWSGYLERVVEALVAAWPRKLHDDLRPALRLVVDFHTWRLLAETEEKERPAALAARMVLGLTD